MPVILQILYIALVVIGVAITLYISIWVLLAIFVMAVIMVAWSHLRDFLLAKGILNPTPGLPQDTTTVIEGEFIRLEADDETKPE